MHFNRVHIKKNTFPRNDVYPFSLPVIQKNRHMQITTKITFFAGENGCGKSTLLNAIARSCGLHIWSEKGWSHCDKNPYRNALHNHISIDWLNGPKPGSIFSAENYDYLAKLIDQWASSDPGLLDYFGGKSLLTQSHGESFMSFFKSRYKIKGVYFLDEPETALSPKWQLAFRDFLTAMAADGHAQFIIATHSPILLSCPGATILNFNAGHIKPIRYKETEHYLVLRDFMHRIEDQ
jgi:predicted ATPase